MPTAKSNYITAPQHGPDLGSSAFSDRNNAVLAWVEDLPNLAHRLGVGGAGGEVASPI